MKNPFKKRNKTAKKVEVQNTFVCVNDIQRKEFFTIYNIDLMNQIRRLYL